MKMPAQFIPFVKKLIERLATFVLGCLALLMVLYYFKTSNPVIKVAQVQSAMALVDQVSQLVLCLTSEIPHLNIHVYL